MDSLPHTVSTPDLSAKGRAWAVAAVTLVALVAASAFRSSTGVLLEPIEAEFGWSRAVTSGAVSLNLVLYGLTAPFAAALMEAWGVRRTVTVALIVVGVASGLTLVMSEPWQLWLLWGVFIGVGTGAMALVFGGIVANRWFDKQRGLVTGIFSAANATGQLVFLPVIAQTAATQGWRWAAGIVTVLAFASAVLVGFALLDSPADIGRTPYGSPAGTPVRQPARSKGSAARTAITTFASVSRSWTFWALMLTFWVCGWSTNGLIQTHFIPAAHDHGMPSTVAAGLLAVVGIFDIAGTVASGWLTDRLDPRWLLGIYYAGRGISLLALNAVLAPGIEPGMWVFIIFYGLDWVATVPPTMALCRTHFGLQRSGVVFGWVFASHMVGAGVGASLAGWMRTQQGTYHMAWILAAALCLAASVLAMTIPRRPSASDANTPALAG